jgi:hypothetical protein
MREWLRGRHDGMATPRPLIDRWVRAATGSPVDSASRIIVGQDNEVHDAVTATHPDSPANGGRWTRPEGSACPLHKCS